MYACGPVSEGRACSRAGLPAGTAAEPAEPDHFPAKRGGGWGGGGGADSGLRRRDARERDGDVDGLRLAWTRTRGAGGLRGQAKSGPPG